jgi:secreted Zn-dependent insulinase-like peptidase
VQAGAHTPRTAALAAVVAQLLSGPAYEVLRTQQQFGYTVTVAAKEHADALGLSVAVTGPLPAAQLLARICDFVEGWVGTEVPRVSQHAFAQAVEAAEPGNVRASSLRAFHACLCAALGACSCPSLIAYTRPRQDTRC